MTAPAAGAPASPHTENGGAVMRPERWKLMALCLATFMLLLDITIVQAALPTIQQRLGGGLSGLQWTIDAYTLPPMSGDKGSSSCASA